MISSVAVVAGAGLLACGGGTRDRIVARVGGSEITNATVAHWMSVMAPEHFVPDPPRYTACIARQKSVSSQPITAAIEEECRQQYRALKQRAMAFLISSQWLIAEAADRGLKASQPGPHEHLDKQPDASFVGSSNTADVKFATDAALAGANIRRALAHDEPAITQTQIVVYYKRNIAGFERRERRDIAIVERLPSQVAAKSAMSRITSAAAMSKLAIHESFERPRRNEVIPRKKAILRTIFAVKPHVLVGPLPLNHFWCFFEVTRVTPAVITPLAQVRRKIERRLASEQRRRTLARFIGALRRKWIARTDCSAGYVVQKCRKYSGVKTPEDPLAFN